MTEAASEGAVALRERTGVSAWDRFWRSPTLIVARRIVHSHLRSGWLWGEIVAVLVLYVVFFDYPGTTGDLSYFYGFGGRSLGAIAAVGAAIMAHRALGARAYLPLARLASRGPYVRGLALAAVATRLPLVVELLALYLRAHHHFQGAWERHFIVGMLGLVANCALIAAVTVVLSPPIATRFNQIVFLFWLVLALSSYTNLGWISTVFSVARLPLLLVVACYNFGSKGVMDWLGALAFALTLAAIVALTWLAEYQFSRRDLLV
jgi:hypothetical protein